MTEERMCSQKTDRFAGKTYEVSARKMAEVYADTMIRLMNDNSDVVELEADLGACIMGGKMDEIGRYPGQLINCGIQAEGVSGTYHFRANGRGDVGKASMHAGRGKRNVLYPLRQKGGRSDLRERTRFHDRERNGSKGRPGRNRHCQRNHGGGSSDGGRTAGRRRHLGKGSGHVYDKAL